MVASLQRRRLKFVFQLATGSFDRVGQPDTVEFEDFRAVVEIQLQGGMTFPTSRATIFGISRDVMDRLTAINFLNLEFMRNSMRIDAMDDYGQWVTVFFGEIFSAQPDYNSMPQVPFVVEAQSGLLGILAPKNPATYPGSRKVSEIMDVLAKEMGLRLENNQVESVLVDQTLAGTTADKIRRVAEAANIDYWIAPEEGILAIAPKNFPRKSEPILFSKETGMIGYPKKMRTGIEVNAIFNPSLRNGCKIKVESDVPSCNGEWYALNQTILLSSELPGGQWQTTIFASSQPFATSYR